MAFFPSQASRDLVRAVAACPSTQTPSPQPESEKNMIRRRRRPNFSHEELQELVKAIECRIHLAEGKLFGNFETHRQAWLDVADEVHAKTGGYVGIDQPGTKSVTTARTATELRLKWIDLACRVRQKWRARLDGHNIREYPSLQMSPLEYSVLAILKKTGGNLFKSPNSSNSRGRLPMNSRFGPKHSTISLNTNNSPNTRLMQHTMTPSHSSSQSALPKVHQVRINGISVQRPSSLPASQAMQKRVSHNEVTVTRMHKEPTRLPQTIITIPDEPSDKRQSVDKRQTVDSRPQSSSTPVIPGFSNGEDNVFNYENGWREMAVRQDQTIALLRELLQESVRRRAVEEESLNLLKTFVSLQARSVELKELKLGLSTQAEGFTIEEDPNSIEVSEEPVLENE